MVNDMKPPEKDQRVGQGWLVPTIKMILNIISLLSVYRWILWVVRKTGRWQDAELIPLWFAEVYTVPIFVLMAVMFFLISNNNNWIWGILLYIAIYRLLDTGRSLVSVMVFESRRRWDQLGGYVLVRDPLRWVALVMANLGEIILYFSFIYLTWGNKFEPPINTKIAAIYQSIAAFIVGGGSEPTSDAARIIIISQVCYFLYFIIIAGPVVFSVIRAKERTYEKLGDNVEPDGRWKLNCKK